MGQQAPEIERLIKRLRKSIRLDRVILFGSRARGDWLYDSDVDLVLVSPDFEGVHFTKRAESVLRLWDGKTRPEPICLTPEEYRKQKERVTVVGEAAKHGVTVYPTRKRTA